MTLDHPNKSIVSLILGQTIEKLVLNNDLVRDKEVLSEYFAYNDHDQ